MFKSDIYLLIPLLYIFTSNKVLGEVLTQCLNGPTEIENLACLGKRINIKNAFYGKTQACSNGIQPNPHNDCIVKTEDMVTLTRDLRLCNGAERCLRAYPDVKDHFFSHCRDGLNSVYGYIEYECVPKTNIPYLEFCPRNGMELTEHTGNEFYFFAQDPEGHDAYKSISFEECSCTLNSTTDRLSLNMRIMDFSLRNYGDESPCPFSINGNDGFSFTFKHCAIRSTAQSTYDFTILGPEVELNVSQKSSESQQGLYLYFFIKADSNITLTCSKPILKKISPTTTEPPTTTTTPYDTTTGTPHNTTDIQPSESKTTPVLTEASPSPTESFLPPLGEIGLGLAVGCLFFLITTIVACACACSNRSRNKQTQNEKPITKAVSRRGSTPPSFTELNVISTLPPELPKNHPVTEPNVVSSPPPELPKNHPVLDGRQNEQPTYINATHQTTEPDYELSKDYYNSPRDEYLPPRN